MKKSEGLPHVFLKEFTVRRIQYPLKPFHASTIHKCIGGDVPSLATQIASTDPSEKKLFKLWERNQLLVLINRVKKLRDLTFVGPRSLTLATTRKICSQSNQWDSFVFNFVSRISHAMPSSNILSIPVWQHVYSVSRQSLPNDSCATICCLLSLKTGSFIAGACMNIRHELQKVNTFNDGNSHEIDQQRPWALICAAFEPSCTIIDEFLLSLECHWNTTISSSDDSTPQNLVELLEQTSKLHCNFYHKLNFVAFINSINWSFTQCI